MPFVEWDKSLSVNVAEIDAQHQGLVKVVNELFDAMSTRRGKARLPETMKRLVEYGQVHFATEEKYMDQFAFAETEAHKLEHEAFRAHLGELKAQADKGRVLVTSKTMDFLRDWLVTHIQGTDRKYTALFNESGLK